ncbi:hypothetical protein EIN_523710 [Entamoeba invadens IP1]|uniref:Ubiquitin-like domain-containing protein n=1 Tax=Entamoeba invadens IP1 TaxID=370355 RepID=A0A0A1UGA3_ENTIV|nr:hypothetical protein EIN_523710 [Entamoeba invadens IP1]ELP92473.1 hypothetical protein EIN_523710 [Entamoeba invadens IP1]|eukprot:XP_004259244.1 hypothetical protein EIN_523710 [Entamoeba invadens IP1]
MSNNYIDLVAAEESHYSLSSQPSVQDQMKMEFGTGSGINVTVRRDGAKKTMKVPKTTTIKQLKEIYSKDTSAALTFKFVGILLKDEKTLDNYTVEDGDTIDCTVDEKAIDPSHFVKLKLRYDNNISSFRISPIDKLEKLFVRFAEKIGEDVTHLKFLFDGYTISMEDTANSQELENNFIIDVIKF